MDACPFERKNSGCFSMDFPTEGEMMTVGKLSKDFMLELCGLGRCPCIQQVTRVLNALTGIPR